MNHFLSPDTIVSAPYNPQSLNRYSYGLNNPSRYTDPSGHVPIEGCGDDGKAHCVATAAEETRNIQHLKKLTQDVYKRQCAAGNTAYCDGDPVKIAAFTLTMWTGGVLLESFILGGGAAGTVDAAGVASKALYDKALYSCLTSYACARIMAKVTGITLYRNWSGDPDTPPEGYTGPWSGTPKIYSGPWGGSWSPIDPSTVDDFRGVAGLPNGVNYGRFVSVGKIYDLSGIIIKVADEIPPNSGGLLEYKFVDPAMSEVQIILQGVFGVNPPY